MSESPRDEEEERKKDDEEPPSDVDSGEGDIFGEKFEIPAFLRKIT